MRSTYLRRRRRSTSARIARAAAVGLAASTCVLTAVALSRPGQGGLRPSREYLLASRKMAAPVRTSAPRRAAVSRPPVKLYRLSLELNRPSVPVTVWVLGKRTNRRLGAFHGRWVSSRPPGFGRTFEAYCIDLEHRNASRTSYNVSVTTTGRLGRVAWLYETYVDEASRDPIKAAALQLALWDALRGSGDDSVMTGKGMEFRVHRASKAVIRQANLYLKASRGRSDVATWLHAQHVGMLYQDLITRKTSPRAAPPPPAALPPIGISRVREYFVEEEPYQPVPVPPSFEASSVTGETPTTPATPPTVPTVPPTVPGVPPSPEPTKPTPQTPPEEPARPRIPPREDTDITPPPTYGGYIIPPYYSYPPVFPLLPPRDDPEPRPPVSVPESGAEWLLAPALLPLLFLRRRGRWAKRAA